MNGKLSCTAIETIIMLLLTSGIKQTIGAASSERLLYKVSAAALSASAKEKENEQ